MKVEEFREELERGLGDLTLVDRATWERVVRRGRRLRQRRRIAPASVLSLLLVALMGLAAVAIGSGPSSKVVASDPPADPPLTVPRIEGGAEAGLYLLASPAPEGLPLLLREGPLDEGGEVNTGDGTERHQRWVRLDDSGRVPEASFDVQWGGSPSSEATRASMLNEGEPVAVGNVDGRYIAQLGLLAWEQPTVGVVALSSEQLDEAQLADLADRLVATDGELSFAEAPAGFKLVFDGTSRISLGGATRRVVYGDGSRGFGLFLVEHSEYQPGLNLYFPEARIVEVRGTDAVLSPRAFSIAGGSLPAAVSYLVNPDWVLQWQEGDTLISATATGLSADALVAFANTLERVDYANWQSTAPP